jgi:hypothetical protein
LVAFSNSVSVAPGETVLTVMPRGPEFLGRDRGQLLDRAFAGGVGTDARKGPRSLHLEMLMIRPPSCICLAAKRMVRKTERVLTAITLSSRPALRSRR